MVRRSLLAFALLFHIGCDRGEISGLPIDAFDPEIAVACQAGCSAPLSELAAETISPQPGASVGELTSCPVSGVVFRIHAESPVVEYQGRQYYTCCSGCAERLRSELAKLTTPD